MASWTKVCTSFTYLSMYLLIHLMIMATRPVTAERLFLQPSTLKASPVDFQLEWMHDFDIRLDDGPYSLQRGHIPPPTELRAPSFVHTFDLIAENTTSITVLAKQAKQLILQESSSGAILFRGLDAVLLNVSDFGTFWSAMNWSTVDHVSCYNRKRQSSDNGAFDFVDTDVPAMVLGPHNEHACNPKPTGRIAFYGIQPATISGGESLLRVNKDIDVPLYMKTFIQHHGGIQTTRTFPDHEEMLQDSTRHPTSMSWQERCNTKSKSECIAFFADRGMTNVTFDSHDALKVTSIHSGWLDGIWYNHLDYGFPTKCADGTDVPHEWQMMLKRRKWDHTFAYKLQKGDWLVLDNQRVQHGRLPYQGNRQLIVTYTNVD